MSLDLSDEYDLIDNLETVTYFIRTNDGSATQFDTGNSVDSVLCRAIPKDEFLQDGLLHEEGLAFHLWTDNLVYTISTVQFPITPKVSDKIERTNGSTWIVQTVEVDTFATRYKCITVEEK